MIALVLVLGLLVAVDRIALVVAEHAAAKTVQVAQNLDRAPSVSIAGFPFLSQLAVGRLRDVRLAASDLSVGQDGRTVRISTVHAHLHGVRVARDLSSVHAERADASALVSYPDLSGALGVPLAYGGPSPDGVGRITAHRTVSIAGRELRGSATAEIRIAAGALTFVSPQVTVDGVGGAALPQQVIDSLSSSFGVPLALVRLPFGLTVRAVTADASGVHISLTGDDLTFEQP